MPKPRVYVETTIPSFYYDRRKDAAVVSRRVWTREWWSTAATEYELVTGAPVLAELLAGITSRVAPRIRLVGELPIFLPDDLVDETVRFYVQHKLMPSRPLEDAQHVAIASHNQCDFIVTWNCKHLANPNKALHLARINSMLGLHVPAIVTPWDLLRREG
jgi:predicted nucleic acid-binding protein